MMVGIKRTRIEPIVSRRSLVLKVWKYESLKPLLLPIIPTIDLAPLYIVLFDLGRDNVQGAETIV